MVGIKVPSVWPPDAKVSAYRLSEVSRARWNAIGAKIWTLAVRTSPGSDGLCAEG